MPDKRGLTTPTTKMIVWGRAAGRCQFRNCGKRLDQDLIAGKTSRNNAYVAHVIAAAPGGERGDPELSYALSDDPENLMLLCDEHHRLIDDPSNLATYTVDVLMEMKRENEERTDRLLSVRSAKRTTILQVSAPIGDNETAVPFDDCATAAVANATLADRHPIEIKLRGMRHKDSDPNYYQTEISSLRKRFDTDVRWRFEERDIEHLSIFGLAPIPILIELGRLISDISDATVFMRHREPSPAWTWPNDGSPVSFEAVEGAKSGKAVALKLSVSAEVSDDRIHAAVGDDVSIWEIRSSVLGTTVLRNQADLTGFRETVGRTFDRIKATHGEETNLMVFPAIPTVCAIEFGRVWQPKAHPPFTIYDQIAGTGFVAKHAISTEH